MPPPDVAAPAPPGRPDWLRLDPRDRSAAELLERALATPLHVDVSVPRGYHEVVDALGDGHADIALPNTTTYLVANERVLAPNGAPSFHASERPHSLRPHRW